MLETAPADLKGGIALGMFTGIEPQTFARSFHFIPALSQSARVSGWGDWSAANAYPLQATAIVKAKAAIGDLIRIPQALMVL